MAKIIMIQGTSSGVGKSIITTALCRIFKEDGYKVAPFKVQNLSSNYFAFENGDKMAKSQVFQAYASGVEPIVEMNPILLAPSGKGCDIILNGKLFGHIDSKMTDEVKDVLFADALKSFDKLNKEYDIIVVEGAGSPVELNLTQYDIVNMGFAEKVNAPVILVSDITRGGVFANLYGTVELFTENQRKLLKGLIINKFVGFVESFADGTKIIEDICKTDVIGVVPHTEIKLEDEDNLPDANGELKGKNQFEDKDNEKYFEFLENEYSKLSTHFRKHLDIKNIYEILEGDK